jgi:hypothetical protein
VTHLARVSRLREDRLTNTGNIVAFENGLPREGETIFIEEERQVVAEVQYSVYKDEASNYISRATVILVRECI